MEPALVQQLKALRVLQPLALLAFIGATILTSISILPVPTFQSGADVSDNYLTALTPVSAAIGGFWGIIILAQIGGLAVLLLSGDVQKQRFLVVVPGRKLAGVNLAMTGWTLAWSTRYFLLAELFLLVALGCTVLIFLELVRFHARVQASKEGRNSRDDSVPGTTMDEKRLGWTLWATVELPVKMMLAIMLLLDLWQNGLLAIGFYKYVGPLLDQPHGRWEPNHETHGLYIVALVTLITTLNATYIFTRTDLVWSLSSLYLALALSSREEGKSPALLIALMLASIVYPVAYLSSLGYSIIKARQRAAGTAGSVRLDSE